MTSGVYNYGSAEAIAQIPVPEVSATDNLKLSSLVDSILAAKRANPSADTSALEAEIDEKVFDLYNLTPEEREIVEAAVKR